MPVSSLPGCSTAMLPLKTHGGFKVVQRHAWMKVPAVMFASTKCPQYFCEAHAIPDNLGLVFSELANFAGSKYSCIGLDQPGIINEQPSR